MKKGHRGKPVTLSYSGSCAIAQDWSILGEGITPEEDYSGKGLLRKHDDFDAGVAADEALEGLANGLLGDALNG